MAINVPMTVQAIAGGLGTLAAANTASPAARRSIQARPTQPKRDADEVIVGLEAVEEPRAVKRLNANTDEEARQDHRRTFEEEADAYSRHGQRVARARRSLDVAG